MRRRSPVDESAQRGEHGGHRLCFVEDYGPLRLLCQVKRWVSGKALARARLFEIDVGVARKRLPGQRRLPHLAGTHDEHRRELPAEGPQPSLRQALPHFCKLEENLLICNLANSGSLLGRMHTAKADTYAALGVAELWLVDLEGRCIEQRILRDGAWKPVGTFAGDAIVTAQTFPGLAATPAAIFA